MKVPVKPDDLRVLPSAAWPPPKGGKAEVLLKLSYLRGLVDALQYAALTPKGAKRVLAGLAGKDLAQIAALVDRYYLMDPKRRDLPPAAVIWRILVGKGGIPKAGKPRK